MQVERVREGKNSSQRKVPMLPKQFKVMEQLLVCNRIKVTVVKKKNKKIDNEGVALATSRYIYTSSAHTFRDSAAAAAHHAPPTLIIYDFFFARMLSSRV